MGVYLPVENKNEQSRGNIRWKIPQKIFGCGIYLFIHLPALFTNALLFYDVFWKEETIFFNVDIEYSAIRFTQFRQEKLILRPFFNKFQKFIFKQSRICLRKSTLLS